MDYVRSEIETIVSIYRPLYPDARLRLMLYEGRSTVEVSVRIAHYEEFIEPHALVSGFLGCVEVAPEAPNPNLHERIVSISASIPRRPTPADAALTEADWAPRGRFLKALFYLSPMRYEQLRYLRERHDERLSATHSWRSLPRHRGSIIMAKKADPVAPVPHNMPSQNHAARPAILIGFHWLEVGGAEALAFDCVRWAQEAGLRVFVVAAVPSLHRLSGRLPEGVTFLRIDRYLKHSDWPLFLEQLIRRENIRLIHIHHCVPLYAALAHLSVVAPWVKIIDSTHIIEYSDGGYPRVSGVWSDFIDVHHVISRQLYQNFVHRFTSPLGKVRLGRMIAKTLGDESVRLLGDPNLSSHATELTISFVGRLYYQKRPILVVLMMHKLNQWARRRGIDLTIHMVGEGPFSGACDGLVRRFRLQDVVRRYPANADVPAILAKTDLLLLPSSNEGLALVCYEAIENGALPLSTNVGGQSEITPPDLLMPREPSKALTKLIAIVERLWSDPDFLKRQHEALQKKYRELSSDPTAEDVLLPLYRAAADRTHHDGESHQGKIRREG